ncbi:putative amino-acid metabolite efflux pump [Pseudoalteromonas holothuriae]|uniref:Amino-acid metabolite efflux pump n=1 Tax=Pseudoalteromonas holothuriae TaxID=2963714 RepID=A0ABN8UNZ8_9GAMM|nr:EamA family transporter [Pseudoalteromonas sp. CIP111951]CAH9059770.1 putative amino-acid metabolite efflux pump [Pseudoalteromonas sp. CIP111951]
MKFPHILVAIFVTLIWGSAFAVIEIGMQGFPPIFNAALRFLTASIPLVFFIKRPKVSPLFLLLFGMNYVLMFSLMYVGMKWGMPSGLTSLVLQTAVLFALILSAFVLQEFPNKIQILGVLIGLSGIALIATDKESFTSISAFLLVLGAAFFYGASSIIMKRAGNVDMLALLIWGCLVPPIPLLGLSLMLETGQWHAFKNMSLMGGFSIYYTSLLGTVLAFALWGWLLKRYPANMVVPFNLLVPVFGIITSYILLNEQVTNTSATACVIIFTGLLVVSFHNRINNWTLQRKRMLRSQQ